MAQLTPAQIAAAAVEAGWSDPDEIRTLVAITLAESGGRTDAIGDRDLTVSGERSVGLAQINYRPGRDETNSVRDPQANLDPVTNLRNARAVYDAQGWCAWSVYEKSCGHAYHVGTYRRHLDDAAEAVRSALSGLVDWPADGSPPPSGEAPTPGDGGTPSATPAMFGDPIQDWAARRLLGLLGVDPENPRAGLFVWVVRGGQVAGGVLLIGLAVVILLRDLSPTNALASVAGDLVSGATK